MKITIQAMAIGTFVPMLETLSQLLDKGAAHAKSKKLDLVNARLAPDMYTLAEQVQLACDHAMDAIAVLTDDVAPDAEDDETTIAALKARIAKTVAFLKAIDADEFEGAETRDCGIDMPNGKVIAMDGVQFLRGWALPHFYFHVVTAYDIMRHNGVAIGKQDYLSQVGALIRPK